MDNLDQFRGFCSTPSIFSGNTNFPYKDFQFPEISITPELEQDVEKLFHPRNSVLGKRMESFFELAIKYSDRYDLIASNIQVIDDGRTLGELDFLVRDISRNKVLHIELIYKLYIFDPENADLGWIGPNRRDSFSKKSTRLIRHQFPLLYQRATRTYLEKLGLNSEDIEQQICFKAKLFPSGEHVNPFHNINPVCITGNWIKKEDLIKRDDAGLYYSPKKRDWSCQPNNNITWYSIEEIISQIEDFCSKEKSPLVWKKTRERFESFFVVWW